MRIVCLVIMTKIIIKILVLAVAIYFIGVNIVYGSTNLSGYFWGSVIGIPIFLRYIFLDIKNYIKKK